jgi:type II secretory ATPase GspE/PulE/Tfp pilus assembly ATPase PilB-like protein
MLAMVDPLDLGAVDDVQFLTGRRVRPVVVSSPAMEAAIAVAFGPSLPELVQALPDTAVPMGTEAARLEQDASAAPVVQLVDHVLDQAVTQGASDIHIEHRGDRVAVRFRIDGMLRSFADVPARSHAAVVSRIKIMAGLDISIKRRPQDGGMAYRGGGTSLTLRVSTLPVDGGEKVVVRLLDPERAAESLDRLGLAPTDLARLRRMLSRNEGVILAAGPTGSGKSTTLFSALAEVDRSRHNVVTVEDPVEYRLPGVNQVQVRPRAGLTFPAALRSILRQDPDVVMVGEIRDRETAEIAMAAAVTGHLVLSTIHTIDAPGAVTRLLHMGVPSFLVAGGLAGVVAQRLVRRVCPSCQGRDPNGCGACVDGHSGRTGVFQVLTMTRKVAEGVTTPHEVGRVLQGDPGAGVPCSSCKQDTPFGALACPRCGVKLRMICTCGEPLQPGWRFCPACVRRITA